MKRTSPLKVHGVRSSDPYTNLSRDQLAAIGAIVMMYNEVEDYLDDMVAHGLGLPVNPVEVTSRINGADGKIEIVKVAAKHWGFDGGEMRILSDSLGDSGFKLLKGYRDAVIHAQVFDIQSSVGRTKQSRGKLADVLLSQEALDGFYSRLDQMRTEMHWLSFAVRKRRSVSDVRNSDRERARLGEESRAGLALAQEHQTRRLSLPPLPEFPADTLDDARFRAVLERLPE